MDYRLIKSFMPASVNEGTSPTYTTHKTRDLCLSLPLVENLCLQDAQKNKRVALMIKLIGDDHVREACGLGYLHERQQLAPPE